ncbi:MAG TPA: hypothetical protein VEU96_07240 [Bryobacteraceae bacterium]|nr:hypothetical protein [Bryobacteraceae bacterium]
MRWVGEAALAGLVIAGITTEVFSAPSQDNAAAKGQASAAAPSIDGIIGKKLIAIDGSLIVLTASEGGLAREVVTPNGAVQKTAFRFINDRLGTVMDSRDTSTVTGVFRIGDSDINIEYADGLSETVLANSAGGISIETKSPTNAAYCTAWYPEGHIFSLEDRKAALAQFASRLGLPDGGERKIDLTTHQGCGSTASAPTELAAKPDAKTDGKAELAKADTKAQAIDAPAPRAGVVGATAIADAGATASKRAQAVKTANTAAPKTTTDVAAETHAIEVRNSKVHLIDTNSATEPTQVEKPEAPAPQKLASLEPNQGMVPPNQRGASNCLWVESDGSHWGFRNKCEYTVQFAYCLMSGGQLASCQDGALTGSVSANGFGALIIDQSLKETDVSHEFRWVACQGGAGEVIPRLEQVNPPSGRCVR